MRSASDKVQNSLEGGTLPTRRTPLRREDDACGVDRDRYREIPPGPVTTAAKASVPNTHNNGISPKAALRATKPIPPSGNCAILHPQTCIHTSERYLEDRRRNSWGQGTTQLPQDWAGRGPIPDNCAPYGDRNVHTSTTCSKTIVFMKRSHTPCPLHGEPGPGSYRDMSS